MIRRLLIIFLLPLYALTAVQTVVPFLGYALNYRYIAENLCENRDKPQLHCNGKCHVAKEVQEQSDTEKREGPRERTQALDWACLPLTAAIAPPVVLRPLLSGTIDCPLLFSPSNPPFHPPRV